MLRFRDILRFDHLDQDLRRHQLGQQPVGLVKQPGRIDRSPRPGRPQRAAGYPDLVTIGQHFKHPGIARNAAHVQELRLHGAGTHCRHSDLPAAQLLRQANGIGRNIGLGGGIHRQPGIGAERGNGRGITLH